MSLPGLAPIPAFPREGSEKYSMTDLLDILANPAFWVAVLRIATPLILGTLGVLLCERAGVLNLGIEGIMVAGAFTGWLAVYAGTPLWVGVGVAALTGLVFGLLHAFLTVGLALSQHVSGLGITLLATALSYFGYRVSFPKVNTPPTITPFAPMDWLPIPILNAQTALTLFALLLVPSIGWVLYRTPVGRALRLVGGNPPAVNLSLAKSFIARNLGDPGLTPADVAAACSISLSYLHRLFANDDATVAGYVREQRLQAVHRDLLDAAVEEPVAHVAERWGITDPAHFSRMFKKRFGVSPGELRRAARQ